ncbi:DNA helicase [Bacillus licheniformis]|nr:DnaB-like helicase C-terminal domain-containing protein [Bacillus licheniformis]ARW46029.1 DNA helicase [Bacillus licheniformis]
MNYGVLMLSKVIEQNDPNALLRFNITAEDLPTEGERKALRYITEYAEKHGGQAPTAEMVTHEVPDFEPNFGIEASYEFIAKKLKNYASLRDFSEIVNGRGDGEESEFIKRWESAQDNPEEFFSWLTEQAERFKIRTNVRSSVGTDIKKDTDKFKAEYENRKAGESFRIWLSKFDFINRAMGGYVSSNVYVIYGKSGRGKSAIALEEAINCAMQGANVLIWSMEMGWYEVLVRLYVSISASIGVTKANLDGVDIEAGFNSRDVRQGKLSDEFESGFMEFLDKMNELIPGNIIVRAVDDEDFGSRKLRDLKADILETKADVVLIDPFTTSITKRTRQRLRAETRPRLRKNSVVWPDKQKRLSLR